MPSQVKRTLRHRADLEGKSLNEVLVETLALAAGGGDVNFVFSDLDELSGLWVDDRKFDQAIAAQDQIDQAAPQLDG